MNSLLARIAFSVVFGTALLLATGCASKVPLQLEGVAQSGKQYTSTLKKVNEFALNHSLEFTADLLPQLPRDNATLTLQTEAMKQRANMVGEVSAYLDTQALYFAQLGALAKGDHSEGTASELKKLVEALNKIPAVDGISKVGKDAIVGMAGHVAQWKHSQQVREVLQRDADVVARALLLNQEILQAQIDWIERREALTRQVEYRDKVIKPYVDDKKLSETWKKAWIGHVKQAPTIELLQQAKAASIDMQQAWVDVLRAQGGFEQLQATFDQLNLKLKTVSGHDPQ